MAHAAIYRARDLHIVPHEKNIGASPTWTQYRDALARQQRRPKRLHGISAGRECVTSRLSENAGIGKRETNTTIRQRCGAERMMVNAIIGKAESTVKIARSSKRCGKMLLTRITDRHATFRMIGRIAKRKKLPCVISPLDIKIQTEIEGRRNGKTN